MEIIIYRHAKPTVSDSEIISGGDFPLWVQRYSAAGICIDKIKIDKEDIVYTSDLIRSIETGKLIGKKIIEDSIFREVEIPLIKFPPVRLKAKLWLFISRSLWLLGLKTKCESFKEAKQRVRRIVGTIELNLLENKRIVIVGHGFLNTLIKKELLHRGWFLKQPKYKNGFLSRMNFQTEQPNTRAKINPNYYTNE